MPRRAVLTISLVFLLLLVGAAVPWTVGRGGLAAAVTAHLRAHYGVELSVTGRSTLALLPTPRVKFEEIALRSDTLSAKAEGGTLRAEFNLLPLLLGRIELGTISLANTQVRASAAALRSQDWAKLMGDEGRNIRLTRLVFVDSSLSWVDREADSLDRINAVLGWSGNHTLSAVASASWRGEIVALKHLQFQPVEMAFGRQSPLTLDLSLPAVHVSVDGRAQWGSAPRFSGKSLIKAASVRRFSSWSGLALPFGSLIEGLAVEGDVAFDQRRLSWPSVTVTVGADTLEGTLAARLDNERPLITGTLAAENVDLSDLVRPLSRSVTALGAWSEEEVDLSRNTGSDLDLRLSATSAKFGRVRLEDMAASVLVRPGRIEASLGRGTYHDGTIKGRLLLNSVADGTELRLQGAFEDLDVASFISTTGQGRWIRGPGLGQFLIEARGRSPADMVRHAAGRGGITVKESELIGVGLAEAIRRVEKRPLNWKGGRTPFHEANLQFTLAGGVAAISESRMTAPDLVTRVQGTLSLIDQQLDLKADVWPTSDSLRSGPQLIFDVSGRWQNLVVTPGARSLFERSGAAKPLFGRSHPSVATSAPVVSAE